MADILRFGYGATITEKGNVSKRVRIDLAPINNLYNQGHGESLIKKAIHDITEDIVGSGALLVDDDTNPEKSSKEWMQTYVDKELIPFMYKAICKSFYMGGFVWSVTKSKYVPGFAVPVLLRDDSYHIEMVWKKDTREYQIFREETGQQRFNNGYKTNDNDVWVTFIENWEPYDNGTIASPVSHALPIMEAYNDLVYSYMHNTTNTRNPLLVVSQTDNILDKKSGANVGSFVIEDGDMEEAQEEILDRRDERAARANAISASIANIRSAGARVNYVVPDGNNEGIAMLKNRFVLPSGQAISNVVNPANIQDPTKWKEVYSNEIKKHIGLPSYYMDSDINQRQVAETVRVMEEFNLKIKKFQKKFSAAFTSVIQHIFRAIALRTKSVRERQMGEINNRIRKVELESIVNKLNNKSTSNTSKDQDNRITQLRSLNLKLAEEKPEDEIMDLKVFFKFSPMTNVETLLQLRDTYVISQETYANYALDISSIPASAGLEESKIEAELRKRKKWQDIIQPEVKKDENQSKSQKTKNGQTASVKKPSSSNGNSSKTQAQKTVATESKKLKDKQ